MLRRIRQFWSRRVSIRVRLTLWHLLLIATILSVYTDYLIRERVTYSLVNQANTALELAAIQTLNHVGENNGHLVFRETDALQLIAQAFDAYLIDSDGNVWDSLGTGNAPALTSPSPGFTTVEEKRPDIREDEWRIYTQRVTLPNSSTTGWLQIAQTLDYDDTVLANWVTEIISVAVLMFVLIAVGGLFLLSRAFKPIKEITRTAQSISTSDLEKRIAYDGPNDEVGRLAMTFNSMLDRLQAGFEREQHFTADAAHELRTPLTALKGRIDVTLSRLGQPADYEDALRDMEKQVDRLISLSNDLLFLARMDHHKRQEQLDDIVLWELFEVLVDQVKPLTEEKDLALETSIPPDIAVRGKPDLLIRLFLNLLDNAIKYTPSGGHISIRAKKHPQQVCVHVHDTGPGISPEHLAHLFDRFYRVEGDRGRHHDPNTQVPGDVAHGGAGLGLSIAREIARAHGGILTVESQVGKGSTFILCLPVLP